MAHIRQSKPDSGLGVQGKVPKNVEVGPSLLGSGTRESSDHPHMAPKNLLDVQGAVLALVVRQQNTNLSGAKTSRPCWFQNRSVEAGTTFKRRGSTICIGEPRS